jgi:O-acetyl-ADP-ribose deacetylase (regulator of RNase III)
MLRSYSFSGGTLNLVQGDITTAHVDAIVNAANSGMRGGGGVDGAIHDAAGPKLYEAEREIIAEIGSLEPGRAVVTPGFQLPAPWIIHTVGPIWRGGDQGEAGILQSAYEQSLCKAEELKLKSIAFPAVSTGVYGFPVEEAAPIALKALAKGLENEILHTIFMYLHGRETFEIWSTIADGLFGPGAAE